MSPRDKIADLKVVLVTGGASGFGAAIVRRFSEEGSKVFILDLNPGETDQAHHADPNVHVVRGDVTRRECWEEVLASAQEAYGRVDVVINNAGITYDRAPIHSKNLKEYEKTFDVNVKPVFLSAQVIAPFMMEQGHGIFINVTSTGYTRPRPGFAIYNASKAAVAVATKTIALEYAPTLRFNGIAPSIGNTAMLRASVGDAEESREHLREVTDSLPMKRLCEPRDIANAAWYLGSDQSSFVTGTILEVDGGRGV